MPPISFTISTNAIASLSSFYPHRARLGKAAHLFHYLRRSVPLPFCGLPGKCLFSKLSISYSSSTDSALSPHIFVWTIGSLCKGSGAIASSSSLLNLQSFCPETGVIVFSVASIGFFVPNDWSFGESAVLVGSLRKPPKRGPEW